MDEIITKKCSKCGERKNISEFSKAKTYKDGINSRCKKCKSELSIEWQKFNSEKSHKNKIGWARNNFEKCCASYHKWLLNNHDKKLEQGKKWIRNNPEKKREMNRNWQIQNPSKVLEYSHNRRSRKCNALGRFTATEWLELKSIYNNSCLCCGRSEPEIKLSPDHVVPLMLGGNNSIKNIQPLCTSCNQKKHTKNIDYRQQLTMI